MTGGDRFAPELSWCPPGRPTRIADLDIRVGAFWLGSGDEPSAVDPWLPVDLRFPDWNGHTVDVLSYGRLSPAARGAYLVWLATGRRAAEAPPAWAALYLLGLERRLLLDGDDDPTLRAEVLALSTVYGSDPGVAALVDRLAELPREIDPPPLDPDASAVPAALAVEVGRRALAGVPVTADWALAWAWFHPAIPRQDAAKLAPHGFARLWRHHFGRRHPDGMIVTPRRRRLTLDHEPANPTLPRPIERTVADASDVIDHPGPEVVLRAITEEVERELQPFARWASRNPDRVSDAAAAALLPDVLLAGSAAGAAVEPLVRWALGQLSGTSSVTVDGSDLTARWVGRGLDRPESLALAQVLERRGVGIEPDVRFGGRPVPADGPVVLFATGGEPVAAPSPAYVLAAVTTELCLAVAAADGAVDDAEVGLLADRIDRIDELSAAERSRLAAHRRLVGERRVDLDEVATRAGTLDEAARRELAGTVLDVALVDGAIGEDERRAVLAVHRMLGVEPDDARLAAPASYAAGDTGESDARAQPTGAGTHPPDAMEDAEPAGREPAPPEPTVPEPTVPGSSPGSEARAVAAVPAPRAVSLDENRLARTQASNASVRDMLGAIFADDEDPEDDRPEPAPAVPEAGEARIGALDARHSSLLRELADAGTWTRPELERACARLAVLPDGALDVVNEASYDLVGDPVIELQDDGAVVVDTDVLEEMRA